MLLILFYLKVRIFQNVPLIVSIITEMNKNCEKVDLDFTSELILRKSLYTKEF